jgi:hypothetical protein
MLSPPATKIGVSQTKLQGVVDKFTVNGALSFPRL